MTACNENTESNVIPKREPNGLPYGIQQQNLVYNSDFRYFSNKEGAEYGTPDGWLYKDAGSGGSIGFDSETNQCVLIKSGGDSLMSFEQHLQEFPRWKDLLLGQRITAKARLSLSTDGEVSFSISDGFDTNTVTKNGSGDFEIEAQLTINTEATIIFIAIESNDPNIVISISRVYANLGNIAVPNLPCIVQGVIGERKQYLATENPPAGELSICKDSEELSEEYTRLDSVINQRYGVGDNGRSLLPNISGYFSRAWDNGATVDPNAEERKAWGESTVTGIM